MMSLNNENQLEQSFEEGIVIDVVREGKEWIVRVHGIYWHARSLSSLATFAPGTTIRVVGRKGNKLWISPE